MNLSEWNQRYRSREEIDHEPARLLVETAKQLPPGRALDLACGAGRNAVWLAQQGWNVVAIDGALEAIRIVHEHAPHIDARVLDLESGDALPFGDETFDLVAILFYLHRPLFAEAKRLLRRNGTIIASAKMTGTYSIARGEMRTYFEDFEIIHEKENEIAEIVARKL